MPQIDDVFMAWLENRMEEAECEHFRSKEMVSSERSLEAMFVLSEVRKMYCICHGLPVVDS